MAHEAARRTRWRSSTCRKRLAGTCTTRASRTFLSCTSLSTADVEALPRGARLLKSPGDKPAAFIARTGEP